MVSARVSLLSALSLFVFLVVVSAQSTINAATNANAATTALFNSSQFLQTALVDFPSRVVATLPIFIDANMRAMNALKILDLSVPGGLIYMPGTQVTQADLNLNFVNSTTQQTLWSLWNIANGSTSIVSIADDSGYFNMYSPLTKSVNGVAQPWTGEVAVVLSSKYQTGSFTGEVCSHPTYWHRVNRNTGVPLSTSIYTNLFCATKQPYYISAKKNRNMMTFYGPFKNPLTGLFIYTAGLSYFSPETNSTHVLINTVLLSRVDDLIQKLSSADILVGYIMQTYKSILIASTVDESYNQTKTAFSSTSRYVRESAKYIQKMGITQDSVVYMPDLGVIVSVKFWNYGSVPANTMQKQDPLDVGSLRWTVVSVATPTTSNIAVESTVTAESTTSATVDATACPFTADDSSKIDETYVMTEAVLGLVAANFVFACIAMGTTIYFNFAAKRGPMAPKQEL